MVLAAAAPAILSLFGKQADPAVPAVMILVGSRIVEAMAGAAQPIQQVISSYRAQLVAANTGMIVAVIVGWFLLPEWGLTGMAIAVTAGLCTGAVLPVIQMWYDEGLTPFSDHSGRTLTITIGVAVVGAALAWLANLLPDLIAVPLAIALMLGSTWVACRFALPYEDRQALGKLGRALRLV
jgi:O-antigen/teichoic acid export membrane protein